MLTGAFDRRSPFLVRDGRKVEKQRTWTDTHGNPSLNVSLLESVSKYVAGQVHSPLAKAESSPQPTQRIHSEQLNFLSTTIEFPINRFWGKCERLVC